MALNKAQLMDVPGGPGVVGAIKAGTNISISADGTISASAGGLPIGTVTSVSANGGTTGMSFTGGPITSSGTLVLGGVLAVANGGTGATTQAQAALGVLPPVAGQAGKFLSTDGTNIVWNPGSGGTLTSVDVSGGVTGMTFTGGPVTSSGVITMAGTLSVTSGGTGASTPNGALANLLPAQTGNDGKYLQTNGGLTTWSAVYPAQTGNAGKFLTTDGTATSWGSVLGLGFGGTGASTQAAAANNILPPQSGNNGKVLRTNGANATWDNSSGPYGGYIFAGATLLSGYTISGTTINVSSITNLGNIGGMTQVRANFAVAAPNTNYMVLSGPVDNLRFLALTDAQTTYVQFGTWYMTTSNSGIGTFTNPAMISNIRFAIVLP